MFTVQETTVWEDNTPNHQYILSDNARWAYDYIRSGDKYPQMFSKPISIDWGRRKYKILSKTEDVAEARSWRIAGSKGNEYIVTEEDGEFKCTCPAALYRNSECKHILQVKNS